MGDHDDRDWRYWFFLFIVVISFGLVLVRAIDLMVIKHSYYQNLARNNRIVEKDIPAARGQIIDRKGRLVAESVYQYYKEDSGLKKFVSEGLYQG